MFCMGEHAITNMKPFTDTDYLLPPEYVDQYKDEVKSTQAPAVHEWHSDEENGWEDIQNE